MHYQMVYIAFLHFRFVSFTPLEKGYFPPTSSSVLADRIVSQKSQLIVTVFLCFHSHSEIVILQLNGLVIVTTKVMQILLYM